MYIAGVYVGHDAGVTLLKDGKIVFSIAEERLSHRKHDSFPILGLTMVRNFTDHVDYLAIADTNFSVYNNSEMQSHMTPFFNENTVVSTALKLGLITGDDIKEGRLIDLGNKKHHTMHAICGYVNSGFDECCAVVMDGAGSGMPDSSQYESETIFDIGEDGIRKVFSRFGNGSLLTSRGPETSGILPGNNYSQDTDIPYYASFDPGCGKMFEAVGSFMGNGYYEPGKTMGLSSYGEHTPIVERMLKKYDNFDFVLGNQDLFWTQYPGYCFVKPYSLGKNYAEIYSKSIEDPDWHVSQMNGYNHQVSAPQQKKMDFHNKDLQNLCYALQVASQEIALSFIKKAIKETGKKKIVLAGGYFLNCVCNYWLLDQLDDDVELFVEPASNDSGISLGLAYAAHIKATGSVPKRSEQIDNIYFGPSYGGEFSDDRGMNFVENVDVEFVAKLLDEGKTVGLYYGGCEYGPRALGNRSILYDPRDPNGKDYVNMVKNREWYRPFAGTILVEHFEEWFETRGLKESPFMMYAMKCKEDKKDLIPSIIHVDGTCRIQTVSKKQNKYYYELIEAFYKRTGIPILFNTSFNLGGEAMVETVQDAIDTVSRSKIDYLYLPEFGIVGNALSE